MAIEEQFLSEDQLRNVIDKATSDKLREGARTLLSQMDEVRKSGGNPVCVLQENGSAFVFDNTELMGN